MKLFFTNTILGTIDITSCRGSYPQNANSIAFILGLLVLFGGVSPAMANTYYWNGATATWGSTGDWSANPTGNPAAGVAPTSADYAVFNGSSYNNVATVCKFGGSTFAAAGLIFSNSSTTQLKSNSTTTQSLTIGAGGVLVNNGAGAVTLGGVSNGLNIILAGSQSWTVNSSGTLTAVNGVTGNASTGNTYALTLNGSSTASNAISGTIGDGTSGGTVAITENGTGLWVLSGSNTYTGATTVSGGTLNLAPGGNPAYGTLYGSPLLTINGGATVNAIGYNAMKGFDGGGMNVTVNGGTLV